MNLDGPSQLAHLIVAANMKRLYWIDDEFGYSDIKASRLLSEKILTLWDLAAGEQLNHPRLKSIIPGSDTDFVQNQLLTILSAESDKNIAREFIESVDRQIAEHDSTHSVGVKDLSAAQFNEIVEAFRQAGADVQTLSLQQWLATTQDIKEQLNVEAVLFIDHDFTREEGGEADTGESILRQVLQFEVQTFTCVLFTHGVARSDEQQKREQIARRLGLSEHTHRFSVVSKENLTAPGTGSDYRALRDAFKDVFIRSWCNAIAEESVDLVTRSFTETKAAILGLNFQEIAAAFFHKPINDGTLEFDVLLRVLLLGARIKLEDSKPENSLIWSQLERIRNVLTLSGLDTVSHPAPQALKALRDRELFDPADVVNRMFCPPSLGDLFRAKHKGKELYFLLIGQPCDLAIRSNGTRKAAEGLFLQVSTKKPRREMFTHKFEFPDLGACWIAYEEPIPVNLYLLDMASFREDGSLTFRSSMKPSGLMLPGVKIRFQRFKAAFDLIRFEDGKQVGALPNRYHRLTIRGSIPGTDTTFTKGEIQMGLQRIGRIRSPYAESLFGGFALHHTRRAFDFDFADLSEFAAGVEHERASEDSAA